MIDLQQLQENWPILGGFVAGLVAWGKTTADAVSAKKSSTAAHNRINGIEKSLQEVSSSTARIETHQEYIKKSIDEIKRGLQPSNERD